jgi:methionyl-tRNA formyltransferase
VRIAIIGQQPFGKSVLESFLARGDDVAGVFCAPEPAGSRPDALRVAAEAFGIAVMQLPNLRGGAAEAALRDLEVDLAVMAYVLQFVPQSFLGIPRYGTIQYHPSLLPKHRGPSSINWPIIKGEAATGLTIFRPTDGLDEGPIILQKAVDIAPDDTVGTLYFNRLFPLGVDALLEASELVVSGRHSEQSQDETEATYEGWCREASAEINWNSHVDLIYNLIRGCDPSPGAWTVLKGEKLCLFDAKKRLTRRYADIGGRPGELLSFDGGSALVAASGGVLEIGRLRVGSTPKTDAATALQSFGTTEGMLMYSETDSASRA